MKNVAQITVTFGILSTILVAAPAMTQNQRPPSVPRTPPNTVFGVTRQSGNCPSNVKLWTSLRQYEGGGEFTVIADTVAIAGAARLVRSTKKLAEFTAPLKSNFASCVGQATSKEETENLYSFQFRNRNVTFRVQLPPDTPSNPSEISYKNVVSSRPAIRWAIAD
ncbi:hypothetical protein [Aerosakkonema funiforme]|uniref:Uncharacterized protein n=1 Tax=Aerosakkonema funiforme FACHB-1375 TaxID=2949571 RepID=A0A926VKT9_9CYAN|nr:hypothetical protein [Aerosakkonema funiforme]MBD2185726.1 hypothetical protein [Aerosakkonema funiforme FACHB-1375]